MRFMDWKLVDYILYYNRDNSDSEYFLRISNKLSIDELSRCPLTLYACLSLYPEFYEVLGLYMKIVRTRDPQTLQRICNIISDKQCSKYKCRIRYELALRSIMLSNNVLLEMLRYKISANFSQTYLQLYYDNVDIALKLWDINPLFRSDGKLIWDMPEEYLRTDSFARILKHIYPETENIPQNLQELLRIIGRENERRIVLNRKQDLYTQFMWLQLHYPHSFSYTKSSLQKEFMNLAQFDYMVLSEE